MANRKPRKRQKRLTIFNALLTILTYWADQHSISLRSGAQLSRDTGISKDYVTDLVYELQGRGDIQIVDRLAHCWKIKVLRPRGKRRIDVSPETDLLMQTVRVWTAEFHLKFAGNSALRAIALGEPVGPYQRAASHEDIAHTTGHQSTIRDDGYKAFAGLIAALKKLRRTLGPIRFDRLRHGGARVQFGGGYSTTKSVYIFRETREDPGWLRPHLNEVRAFLESSSAAEERERLMKAILEITKDKDSIRWTSIRRLAERAGLQRDPARYRLRQMETLGDVNVINSSRNKSDGPHGPKGLWGPTGIRVVSMIGRPIRLSAEVRDADRKTAKEETLEAWTIYRDQTGIPLTPKFRKKYSSWHQIYKSHDTSDLQTLRVMKSQTANPKG